MQLTFEIDDKIANEFFNLVPEKKRSFYLSQLLNKALFNKTTDTNELPFEPFPNRGIIVTDEIVNRIREEEGI